MNPQVRADDRRYDLVHTVAHLVQRQRAVNLLTTSLIQLDELLLHGAPLAEG